MTVAPIPVLATTVPATADAGVLWQNLADALNALIDARLFPDFHDLYGSRNDWQHQPYASAAARADAPWVVFDLSTRQFIVSSRERVLNGEHGRRNRRSRNRRRWPPAPPAIRGPCRAALLPPPPASAGGGGVRACARLRLLTAVRPRYEPPADRAVPTFPPPWCRRSHPAPERPPATMSFTLLRAAYARLFPTQESAAFSCARCGLRVQITNAPDAVNKILTVMDSHPRPCKANPKTL